MKGLSKLSICLAAGCIGGLLSGLLLYLCGALGLMHEYGVRMAPPLSAYWLYERVVWGGVFGVLFALPQTEKMSWPLRGMLISAAPILAQFFIFYPLVTHEGLFGVRLGQNTPYFVALFSMTWGLISAFWLKLAR